MADVSLGQLVQIHLDEAAADSEPQPAAGSADETGGDPEVAREDAKRRVHASEFDGLLVIPATLPDEGQAEYVAPNVSAFQMLSILERSVSNVMVADRLTTAGLDPEGEDLVRP